MKHKKVLCGLAILLTSCTFSVYMAYTKKDVNQARFIAVNRAPLAGGYPNPYLAARVRYYNETLTYLKNAKDMGFAAYSKSDCYDWDIQNIPVLSRVNLTAMNFVATIDDAINLYSFLARNP